MRHARVGCAVAFARARPPPNARAAPPRRPAARPALRYIGVKQHKNALRMLSRCFAAPAEMLSAIAVAAWKKATLLSLITEGLEWQPPASFYARLDQDLKRSGQGVTAYRTSARRFSRRSARARSRRW